MLYYMQLFAYLTIRPGRPKRLFFSYGRNRNCRRNHIFSFGRNRNHAETVITVSAVTETETETEVISLYATTELT